MLPELIIGLASLIALAASWGYQQPIHRRKRLTLDELLNLDQHDPTEQQ